MSKASGRIGAGLEYVKPGAKLNIDTARRLMSQRGYTVGAGSYNAKGGTTSYQVTRGDKSFRLTSAQIKRRIARK